MKKIVSIFGILVLIIMLTSCSSRIEVDKSLVFTYSFQHNGYLLYDVKENPSKLEIPKKYKNEKVVGIHKNAFNNCSDIQEIILPDSLVYIPQDIFKKINENAFIEYDGILYLDKYLYRVKDRSKETYNIKEGTIYICDNAFGGCKNLKTQTIPNSVKYIGNDVFNNSNNLTDLIIPDHTIILGKLFLIIPSSLNVEYNNHSIYLGNTWLGTDTKVIKEIHVKEGTVNICPSHYQKQSSVDINKLYIPATVKRINDKCFDSPILYDMQEVYFEGEMEYIGEYSFSGESELKKFDLKKGVKYISPSALAYSVNIEGELYDDGALVYINDVLIRVNDKTRITYNLKKNTRFIMMYAFSDCNNLEEIKLPNKIESLYIRTFNECHNLKSITIPKSVKEMNGAILYGEDKIEEINISKYNKYYYSKDNCIIEKETMRLLYSPLNSVIPEDIQYINQYSISIDDKSYRVIPEYVQITDINQFNWTKKENYVFSYCKSQLYYLNSLSSKLNPPIEDGYDFLIINYEYKETKPDIEGYYWHYVDNVKVIWE